MWLPEAHPGTVLGLTIGVNIINNHYPTKPGRRCPLTGHNNRELQRVWAHSANDRGERHLLTDHLRKVAVLAGDLAKRFGGEYLCHLAGLLHDAGKADPEWQRLLMECEQGNRKRVGLDHKCAGAVLAETAHWSVGLLIQAHHGGLRNPQDYKSWLHQKQRLPGPGKAIEALKRIMDDLDITPPELPGFVSTGREADLFLRFCFSALVDADSLDTEQHSLANAPPHRGSAATMTDLWDRYQAFVDDQPTGRGVVNRIRREVHDACLRMATAPPGIYRLTVPTGGGKTRSGMAFALRHALAHGKRRVVVAVPFTTITEQTASVYRDIFEKGHPPDTEAVVLEHHSSAGEGRGSSDTGDDSGFGREAVWQRLAAENWDAPIVVTTTVQLFESLFSNRRSKTRKLHNLADSVIVIDEAQALPDGLLSPIIDVLGSLTENYGATVVLSTATQPAFEQIKEFGELNAREIVADHPQHFQALKRVEYEWRVDHPTQWAEVAGWLRPEHQALVIVNTKRHALELLDELDDPTALHLSTLLCSAHRQEVVKEIHKRLDAGEPCRVVSTQVVEAGVDVDFPAVYRAEAPLDSIIQAAGRCNREGNLNNPGSVVVFQPPDDAMPPGVYRSGTDLTEVIRRTPDFDPDDPDTVRQYFKSLFGLVVNSDQHDIQGRRDTLDFPEVAKRFRMIPDDTFDIVVVDYPHAERDINGIVERLRDKPSGYGTARELMRQIQPYTVQVPLHQVEHLQARGRITPILPERLGQWDGTYDLVRGITDTDPTLVI